MGIDTSFLKDLVVSEMKLNLLAQKDFFERYHCAAVSVVVSEKVYFQPHNKSLTIGHIVQIMLKSPELAIIYYVNNEKQAFAFDEVKFLSPVKS